MLNYSKFEPLVAFMLPSSQMTEAHLLLSMWNTSHKHKFLSVAFSNQFFFLPAGLWLSEQIAGNLIFLCMAKGEIPNPFFIIYVQKFISRTCLVSSFLFPFLIFVFIFYALLHFLCFKISQHTNCWIRFCVTFWLSEVYLETRLSISHLFILLLMIFNTRSVKPLRNLQL